MSVPFSMIECLATRGPGGGEELALSFRIAQRVAEAGCLRDIRIEGVPPGALLALRVGADLRTAFLLESCSDPCGRTVTAGDMLAAIYGLGHAGQLQVPASDFLRTVWASGASVQLRVCLRDLSCADVKAILVAGDCA